MSRVWATARVLAALLASFYAASVLGRWLGEHARWSGYSPDEQARIRADERRLRGLGEPDHFDVLQDDDSVPISASGMYWTHRHGPITVYVAKRVPCGSCGAEEPA